MSSESFALRGKGRRSAARGGIVDDTALAHALDVQAVYANRDENIFDTFVVCLVCALVALAPRALYLRSLLASRVCVWFGELACGLDEARLRMWTGGPVDLAHADGDYPLFSLVAAGQAATIVVVTAPSAAGVLTNWVIIGRTGVDGFNGNNSAESVTVALTPGCAEKLARYALVPGERYESPYVLKRTSARFVLSGYSDEDVRASALHPQRGCQ